MELNHIRFRLVCIVAEVEQLSICNPFGSVEIYIKADASAFISFLDLRRYVFAVQVIDNGRPACLAEIL